MLDLETVGKHGGGLKSGRNCSRAIFTIGAHYRPDRFSPVPVTERVLEPNTPGRRTAVAKFSLKFARVMRFEAPSLDRVRWPRHWLPGGILNCSAFFADSPLTPPGDDDTI